MSIITWDNLKSIVTQNYPEADLHDLVKAYDFSKKAHSGQKRKTGEDYIHHSLATAYNLAKLHMDLPTIIAGLLHDVPEDTEVTLDDIKKEFGSEIATLVSGITKLGTLKYRGIERYAENLRKMFIAMAQDLRIIIIKLADRLHNVQSLDAHRPDKARGDRRDRTDGTRQDNTMIYIQTADKIHTDGRQSDFRFSLYLRGKTLFSLKSLLAIYYYYKEKKVLGS